LFRVEKGGNPDLVRESQRRRYAPVEAVDKVIALDTTWRDARFELDNLNRDYNKINKEVGKLKVANADASGPIAECQAIEEKIFVAKAAEAEAEAAVKASADAEAAAKAEAAAAAQRAKEVAESEAKIKADIEADEEAEAKAREEQETKKESG